jgi:hypothetical protein
MLNLQEPTESIEKPLQIVQDSFDYETELTQSNVAQTNVANNDNLFERLLNQPESPPNQLLGMIDANGMEVVEYPIGSGIKWHRNNAQQPWERV